MHFQASMHASMQSRLERVSQTQQFERQSNERVEIKAHAVPQLIRLA